ncbi:MAG: THUMP domain-containing protein [Candidatus Pacearchaeota archaeon]|nr:THUMP domain-containing protein [Candidatus Pacearchaeota archaeon]
MAEGNLLVSFDPVHEESSKAEILGLLKEAKQEGKIINMSEGLAEVYVKDARKAIKSLIEIAKKNIEKFKYTFNWWPVDKWCKAEIKDMQAVIKKLQEGIKKEERWKMDLIKRRAVKEYGKDLIIKLTDVVDKPKVDLTNPEKIIKVEIDKDRAGISLLTPEEILSVQKFKK